MLVPLAKDKTTPICGCKSVGNPGYGNVLILALLGLLLHQTLILSPLSSTFPPTSIILAVIDSKCFVIQFFNNKSPLVATAASMKVPASIWSGTTE